MKEKFSTNPLSKKTYALILTFIILIGGSFFYFTSINNLNSAQMKEKSSESMNADVSQKSMETQNINDANQKQTNILSIFKYKLNGIQEDNVYIKTNPDGIQKLFYYSPVNEPLNIQLSEGNIGEYQIHSIGGQNYYPLILGYEEAKIMRDENLFADIGDPIKNFFGKNVVIIGVMRRTGGAMDMVHLIPLSEGELN